MEKNKIGVNELGRLTNTSGAQISHIIKGKKYGVDKFLNILDIFPQLNPYWLIYGQGEMEFPSEVKSTSTITEAINKMREYQAENETLKGELDKVKMVNEKLKSAIDYQNLTIEAYKKTIEVQTASINDLKDMLTLAKGNSLHGKNKIA